jgi:hypothetical protein
MGDKLKTKNDVRQCQHFGVVDLTIHYTLGAGLAEQLGDHVEQAVMAAIGSLGNTRNEFIFNYRLIRMAVFWHCRYVEGPHRKLLSGALSLHLSNDHEDNLSYSVDWFWV